MGAAGPQRWELLRHVVGVCACLVLGWFGIAQGMRIPLLADATYGFHALGHLVTWFLPEAYRAMMGSALQVLIPLGLAGYFLLFHGDLLGVSLMLAWAGISTNDTALYVADAPVGLMKIAPGHVVQDWSIALGPLGLNRMAASDELAWALQAAALACVLVGVGVATWGATRALLERPAVDRAQSYLERRPVMRSDDDSWPVEGLRDRQWEGDSSASNWDGSGR